MFGSGLDVAAGMVGRKRFAIGTAALLAAMSCVLFAPALFGGRVLSPSAGIDQSAPFASVGSGLQRLPNAGLNDLTVLFEDHLAFARSAITSGRLPLWDPAIGAGRPLGAGQGAPFFVTSWLADVLPFWSSLAWIALVKLALAGLGMALFVREMKLGRTAALVSGLSYAFSSLFIAFLGHGQTAAFLLVPWSLLAAERLVSTADVAPALGLGALLGLAAYNGHPESFFLSAVVSVAFLLFRLAAWQRSPSRHESPRRRWLLSVLALLIAAAIAVFELASLMTVLGRGVALSQPPAVHGSLSDLLAGATMPEFWGRPDKQMFNDTATAIFTHVFFGRPYIGVIPVLLAVIGCLRRRSGRQWFFVILGLTGILLALGGPQLAAVRLIPGFAQVNAFEYLWPATLALSVLAGFGTHTVLSDNPRALAYGGVVVMTAVVATIAYAIHLRAGIPAHLGSGVRDIPTLRPDESSADAAAAGALMRFVLFAAALGAILLAGRRSVPRSWRSVLLVGCVALDLVLIAHGYWPMPRQQAVAPAPTATLRIAQASGPQWRVAGISDAFTSDLAERYGVMDARVDDLPMLPRYTRLFDALGGVVAPAYGQTAISALNPPQRKLLDLLSTRWIFSDRPPGTPSPALTVVSKRPGDTLIENRQALPRAFLAYDDQGATGVDEALTEVTSASAPALYRSPVIEGAATQAGAHAPGRVQIEQSTADRVALDFVATRSAWLVLTDAYDPGWSVTVDGRPATIYPANVDFRAVRVPAGRHRVTFAYTATGLHVAFWFSAVALIAVMAAAVAIVLRKMLRDRRDLRRWPAG